MSQEDEILLFCDECQKAIQGIPILNHLHPGKTFCHRCYKSCHTCGWKGPNGFFARYTIKPPNGIGAGEPMFLCAGCRPNNYILR